MKKIVSLALALAVISVATAQTSTDLKKENLVDRASDHLMIQLSTDHWSNMPDTINPYQKGFSRGLSIYFMVDKPFKTDPRYSVAYGIGVGNSNIFFQNEQVNLVSTSTTLPFPISNPTGSANTAPYFKKYKLATSYLEVPIEIRYTAHPEQENKSFKLAAGMKFGVILDAHTKGKDYISDGATNDYSEKESSTNFFPTGRVMATARVGYGVFSIFGNYQVTSLFKPGAGPNIQFFQIGLGISGL